jgi:hypothetical protein
LDFEVFDKVASGVLDFSLELLPSSEYKKYSNGFNIDFEGSRYYVEPSENSIKKIEVDNGKPNFTNWEEYVNIRERDPSEYRKKVLIKKTTK